MTASGGSDEWAEGGRPLRLLTFVSARESLATADELRRLPGLLPR